MMRTILPDDILLHYLPFIVCSLVPLSGPAPCAVGVDYLSAGTLYRCPVLSVDVCRVCKVYQPLALPERAQVLSSNAEDV